MARDVREGREVIYDAAAEFAAQHLRSDGSLFTPGRGVATSENLRELHTRFNQQPDTGAESFLEKFQHQLDGAPDDVIQLAAELLYVHLLFASDIGGASKRETISTVTSWMREPSPVPPERDAALDLGLAKTGIAFKTYRPHQLWLLIDFLRAWKAEADPRQQEMLEDPWAFKDFLFSVPLQAAYTQREALLHLVHPDTFEHIVSREHKRLIVEAFKDHADAHADVDRALLAIRQSLEEEGEFYGFYAPGVAEQWRPQSGTDESEDSGAGRVHAWLVRDKVSGRSRVAHWLEDGYASVGWKAVGRDVLGASRPELATAVEGAFPEDSPGRRGVTVGNLDRFLRQMKVGDLIVTPNGDRIYVGVITSAASFVDGSDESFRRSVEWANPTDPIGRGELSPSSYSKLRTLLTVSDVSEEAAEFLRLAGIETADIDNVDVPPAKVDVSLPSADDDLAKDLLLPRAWLQDTIDLLTEKRQVIFYGPPGTGKTFVAQRLADHLTQHGGTYVVVQFHPSYAYEDFFEGFRPRESAGGAGVSFELVPGPLRRLAEEASDDPESPYVLIIDEINRANLAKVFGELYFLLEYREHAITLQYSPDVEFELPPNLYIIGTMNTADRSIALVDAAMRRRFYFVGFFPQRAPIEGLLRDWLKRRGLSGEAADLLDVLNRRIDDENFAMGPSYLMTPAVERSQGLERIWQHAVIPLLEEHYLGTGVDVENRFGLAALRRSLSAASGPTLPGAADEVPPGQDDPSEGAAWTDATS